MFMFPFSFLGQEWNKIPKKAGGKNKTFSTSTPVSVRNSYSALEVEEEDDDDDDIDLLLDELEVPMPLSRKMRKGRKAKKISPPGRDFNGKTQMQFIIKTKIK